MKVGVCVKQVPASDTRIKISDPSAGIATSDIKWEINPYDEYALEEALRMKDAKTASEVVIFSLGGKDAEARIREGLARGADSAVRLEDAAFDGSDCLGTARILAAAAKAEGVEVLLAGKSAIDGDNAQVPAMMAEVLGWAGAMVVTQLEISGGHFKAWRAAGGGAREVVEGALPVVITADKGLNEPRYSSLKGIMMAKKKAIAVKGAADLGIDVLTVGAGAALTSESAWAEPPARPAGRILEGDNDARVKELVRLLREEAKVI